MFGTVSRVSALQRQRLQYKMYSSFCTTGIVGGSLSFVLPGLVDVRSNLDLTAHGRVELMH